ncbi:MAG: putative cytochrome, partial [Rhodospirillales bacterium]|nr:putative cytochrome [Rhodospirillales bacterium]
GDVRLGGAPIKKGDWVLFGITAANNDPKVFPNPRKFDPSRDNRELISFGRGVHFCLGMHLARRELETALKVVFERYPDMRLTPGSKVEYVGGVLRGPRELRVQPYGQA